MNGHESVVTISPDRQYAKPIATSSAPKRFSGRRCHARRPVEIDAPPMIGPKTAIRSRWWPPTLWIATASGTAEATRPSAASTTSARCRLGEEAGKACPNLVHRSAHSEAFMRSDRRLRIICSVKLERGTLGPFGVLEGGGGPPLVFLGGLSPEQGVDAAGTAWMNDSLLRPFARRRRVVFVNRRAGLPRGMTMAELAGEHAAAIRAAFGGPVDLAGISTGGSIAQQLAADHPELVRRLVLLSTACRLGPVGKTMQRRVAARVRRGASARPSRW